MHVLLVADILLIEVIDVDLLLAVARAQKLEKVGLKLVGEVVDGFARVLANDHHVPDV